jgi:uncharacterized membrane protein
MQNPNPKHLKWLVESRRQNQEISAHLYELMTLKCWKPPKLGYEAKTLVGIGFSLWRAAFLANKSGKLEETNAHATYFLGEMLETNAIAFTQDKINYIFEHIRFGWATPRNELEIISQEEGEDVLKECNPPKIIH